MIMQLERIIHDQSLGRSLYLYDFTKSEHVKKKKEDDKKDDIGLGLELDDVELDSRDNVFGFLQIQEPPYKSERVYNNSNYLFYNKME